MVTKIIKSNITKLALGSFITIVLGLGTWGLSNIVTGMQEASAMHVRTLALESDINNVLGSLSYYVRKDEFNSQLSRLDTTMCDTTKKFENKFERLEEKLDVKFDSLNRLIIDEIRKTNKK